MRKNSRRQEDMTASPDKYPQGYFVAKGCKECKFVFTPLAPSHLYCSDICKDKAHANNYYQRVYGISLEYFLELLGEQRGVCAICEEEGFRMHEGIKETLVVDHCHKTGRVRGLLCNNCNRGLGLFQDNYLTLRKAMGYLSELRTDETTTKTRTRYIV